MMFVAGCWISLHTSVLQIFQVFASLLAIMRINVIFILYYVDFADIRLVGHWMKSRTTLNVYNTHIKTLRDSIALDLHGTSSKNKVSNTSYNI
jgi:NADH:ubiquinone oxidoreductase subunit 6 (subunit J)